VSNRNDSYFVGRNLIEDAVGKSTQDIPAPQPAEDRADVWVRQYATNGLVNVGHERKAELGIRTRRIEGSGILQLAKRKRKNNELHFRVARTRARASAIGMT